MTRTRVPRLLLVTDRRSSRIPLPELASRSIAGGVDVVQVREKDLDVVQLRSVVASVLAAAGDRAKVSVNGNLSLAADLGVGLHLPEAGATPTEARARLGPDTLIGRSVHSPVTARDSAGADYLVAGHVFATASKPDLPPIGIDGLRRIVDASSCPVLAIGGITNEHVRAVLSAGAHGVAVVSAINRSDRPELAARSMRAMLEEGRNTLMANVAAQIDVTINGKPVVLDEGTTIQAFLHAKGYEDRLVVVELNESILPRGSYPSTVLSAGDRVEVVHFVGGG